MCQPRTRGVTALRWWGGRRLGREGRKERRRETNDDMEVNERRREGGAEGEREGGGKEPFSRTKRRASVRS